MKFRGFFRRTLALLMAAVLAFSTSYAQDKAKYVFLFIGDGMGLAHISMTEAWLSQKDGKISNTPLGFTQFPVMGVATTYSASNIITCSSAAATALASGYKANNSTVGIYPADSIPLHQISYKLKELGYKIGIMTSVTIDHATPACFYAHNERRKNYFEIAMELPESGFDFFGGGGFEGARNKEIKDAADQIYNKINEYGYTVALGVDDYKAKKAGASKMILFQDGKKKRDSALHTVIGRKDGELTLAQVVESAIDFMYEPDGKGFFIMAEGGQIDWEAHSNRAAGVITETIDFDKAINVAYEFYKQHPDETLIVVTADHETGGLALGRERGYVFDLTVFNDAINGKSVSKEAIDSLNKSARIGWSTKSHTGIPVPVFAIGTGSQMFAGRIDNTDIPKNIMKAMAATPVYTDHYYKRKAVFDKERPIGENDIVFLGNSLTEGGKWETYFPEVQKALEKKGGAIRNRGIVGDTFGGIDARLDQILPGHPKTIFFLTGANDVSHNLTADSIANGIINVVRRIKKESPKTKIYLQSLLPINESFKRYRLLTGKTAMFSEINAKLEKMAKEEKVTFINLYPLMLTNGPADLALPASEQVLRPEITRDGLHITQEGYKIWADAIRKYVK
ncbi:MAG: alkaline phosphatase [Bacteroidales bacterium]|nr:alkaline phosphatase [Bacteroidales bacterium]